ncbi:hypothetical protein [Salinimicrobium sp. HB62]|uniref:hypothetical protein n=1 Tax=Salinimicrobium sp. HB62 TaxID=3077781 RepID=UPI002D76FDF4|nr:hypothetical protein [Salinimicrobium sp. HB62]
MAAENTRIYMIVNTKEIQPGSVDKHVKFKDNRGNKEPQGDPVNFTSEVSAGKKVFWLGEPKDEQRDTIEITGVKRKGDGPRLLQDIGSDPSHRGSYTAQVVDEYIEGLESYSLTFRIKGHKVEYEVDPKIRMVNVE